MLNKMTDNPKIVFCLSGKRKSGKDYISEALFRRLKRESVIIRLSAPIKEHWAKINQLDLDKLLGDSLYKESYRAEMIKWGEAKRKQDPGCFCEAAIEMFKAKEKPVWIVSDMRRKTDLTFFHERYGDRVKAVRITVSDAVRNQRGYHFTPGVDDAESECDLDDWTNWDAVIDNSVENGSIENTLQKLINMYTLEQNN